MSKPTIGKAAREAIGLEPDEEPLFWPNGEDLSDPHALAYVSKKEIWLSCKGEAASSVWILYGPPDEGFEWQQTGRQFADFQCSWGTLIEAFS